MQHTLTGRFEVRLISHEALAQYMSFRGFTVRSLARRIGTSPALVGHLRSGKRNTCSIEVAKAIESTLDAPRGSLFVPRVSHVVGYAA
jgi:transcriptional regulator with XRE-family HTH domain